MGLPRWLFERMCEQGIGQTLPSDRDCETSEKYQPLHASTKPSEVIPGQSNPTNYKKPEPVRPYNPNR